MDVQEEKSELLFPNLVTTLETLLQETNLLKYNLSAQIKEANSLTEWELPGDNDNESDEQTEAENTERTDEAAVDRMVEEMVSENISSAVEHARNVRKTSILNKLVSKENKTKSEQNSKLAKPKAGNLKHRTMTIKMCSAKSDTNSKPSTPDSGSAKSQRINRTEKKCSQPLSKKKPTHLESTYQKDYLSVAKQIQKVNTKSVNKIETSVAQMNTDCKSNVFSFTDIDNLLSRVTPYPCNTSSQSKRSFTSDRDSESREEISARRRASREAGKRQIEKLKLKKKTSLKEAIDILGVPSELDGVLKVYHKYLDKRKYYNEEEDTLKHEFLNQLKIQNKNELVNGFSYQPEVQAKVIKLLSVAGNMEEEGKVNFKLDVESTNDFLGGFNSNEDLCLYYSDKEQLEMFERKQDELVQLKLKMKICESILKDLNSSEFEQKHIVTIYKVVAALKDITSLSVPVIFRK